MLGVYIVPLFPQEEVMHSSFWGNRCTYLAAHSSKRFKPLSAVVLLCQGYCWIGKNTSKEFNCYDVLTIRPRTKHFVIPFFFFFFWFQLTSMGSLFLITFLKLLATHFGGVVTNIISISVMWTDDFWLYVTDLIPCLWIKATKYIPEYWERSVKRKCNLNFIRVIKNSSFEEHFVYIWSKPKKSLVTISCFLLRSPC